MAEPASKDSSGHYFEPSPSSRSAPQEIRLDLPDLSLTLATDRGVFSPDRIDTGTKHLLLDGPAPASEGTLVDLGCGYGPIACALARRSPAATVWAVDVNERALDLCRANAERLGLANVRGRPGGRGGGGSGRRRPVVEPTHPHRQGRPARRCSAPGWAGWRPPGAPSWSCRSTSGPTRSTGGWRQRAGPWTDAARGRGTACSRCAGREAARRHRHEAAPPRVAAPHGRSRGARARRCAGPVQRRRHHPHGRRLPRRRRVAGRAHARPRRRARSARPRSAPSATSPSTAPTPRSRRSMPPGRLAIASWGSSWPTAPPRCTSWRRRTRRASSSVTKTEAAARPRWRPAMTSPSCHCSAGSGRSTSPAPRRSRCTSYGARHGRMPTTPTPPEDPQT